MAQVNLNGRENGITSEYIASIERSLGTAAAFAVLSHYKLTKETPDSVALHAIIQFLTDISWYAPAVKLTSVWHGPSYLAHFNEHNPWDGRYKGQTNHLLDTAYMWGNYNDRYEEFNWRTARHLAEDNIAFTNGKDELPRINGSVSNADRIVCIYGPGDEAKFSMLDKLGGPKTGRNHAIFALAEEVGGLDVLQAASDAFLEAK